MSRQLSFRLGKGEGFGRVTRLTSSIFFVRFAGCEMQVPGKARVRLGQQSLGGHSASKTKSLSAINP
jgi:hypothetical protein